MNLHIFFKLKKELLKLVMINEKNKFIGQLSMKIYALNVQQYNQKKNIIIVIHVINGFV